MYHTTTIRLTLRQKFRQYDHKKTIKITKLKFDSGMFLYVYYMDLLIYLLSCKICGQYVGM